MAEGYRSAIPSADFVDSITCGDALAGAITALGYRLRHGQSIWLSLPISSAGDLGWVLRYVHALRMESLRGVLRSNWFNHRNMSERQDLLVWTNRRAQFTALREDKALGVDMVRSSSRGGEGIIPLRNPDRIFRTLLIQMTHNNIQLCSDLSTASSPFAIVVDATPFGKRDGLREVLETIASFHKGVPVIVLTAVGDLHTEQQIQHLKSPMWRQPLGRGLFPAKRLVAPSPRLLIACDNTMNEHLIALAEKGRSVKDAIAGSQGLRSVIQGIDQVISPLRALCVPVAFYEKYQDANRRGGPYPVKPVVDWIDDLGRAELPSGQSQNALDEFIFQAEQLLEMLMEGEVGKQQAVNKWLQEHQNKGQRIAIGVTGERASVLLTSWMMNEHAEELNDGRLRVIGINSSRDLYRHGQEPLDRLLLIAPLWAQGYWAFALADNTDLLCYESESVWAERYGQRWSPLLAGDSDNGEWWSLAPSRYQYVRASEKGIPVERWTDCSGQYVHRIKLDLDHPDDGDWFEQLMEPIAEPPPSTSREPEDDEVVVLTEAGRRHSFHCRQRIYVYREGDSSIDRIIAGDLVPGDTLILTDEGSDDTADLLRVLIDYTQANTENYESFQMFARRWDDYITHAVETCGGVDGLHKALAAAGTKVDVATVRGWANLARIGPGHGGQGTLDYTFAVAKLSGLVSKKTEVQKVAKAIDKIRHTHRDLGKRLRQYVIAASSPNTEVNGHIADAIDPKIIADVVHLETIEKIIQYPNIVLDESKSLASTLSDYVSISENVVATSRAEKSAEKSGFSNLGKADKCLQLLESEFHDVYTGKIRIEEAVQAAKRAGISYAGGMSAVTQGQHADTYKVRYKGANVDIGKHLRVGTSYNPEHCFRCHFHWDEADQKIVVHHFGRHLPTRK
ncbi:MAG: hypothetical protein CMN81_10340 [Spongiibacter sp.]|nr:hypothetical protein [Spongiibacter sp.]